MAEAIDRELDSPEGGRTPWPVLAAVAVVAVPLALLVPEGWSERFAFHVCFLFVVLRAAVAVLIAAPVLWLLAPKHQKVKTGSLVMMWLWVSGAYLQFNRAFGGGKEPPFLLGALVVIGSGVLLGFLQLRYGPKWEQEWLREEGRRLFRMPRRTGWESAREAARNLLASGDSGDFLRWEGIRIILLGALAGIALPAFLGRGALRVSVAFTAVFVVLVWNWLRLWLHADRARKTSAFNLTFLLLVFLAVTSPLLGFSDIKLGAKFMGHEVYVFMVTDSSVLIVLSAVRAFWGRKWEKEMEDREAAIT